MRSKRSVVAVILAVASIAVVAAAAPAQAGIISWNYCGRLVNPMAGCWYLEGVSNVTRNVASYPGAGTVSVCERIADDYNGRNYSRRCANNYVDSASDVNGSLGWTWVAVGNNSAYAHTIDGTAYRRT